MGISKAIKTDYQTAYNSTRFEIRSSIPDQAPLVFHMNPGNDTYSNSSNVTFFYNASDVNNNIANATLIINGILNATNLSAVV